MVVYRQLVGEVPHGNRRVQDEKLLAARGANWRLCSAHPGCASTYAPRQVHGHRKRATTRAHGKRWDDTIGTIADHREAERERLLPWPFPHTKGRRNLPRAGLSV